MVSSVCCRSKKTSKFRKTSVILSLLFNKYIQISNVKASIFFSASLIAVAYPWVSWELVSYYYVSFLSWDVLSLLALYDFPCSTYSWNSYRINTGKSACTECKWSLAHYFRCHIWQPCNSFSRHCSSLFWKMDIKINWINICMCFFMAHITSNRGGILFNLLKKHKTKKKQNIKRKY
jgi:hypothetical protein